LLQCVAVCCSVLQCVAVCCSVLQCVAVCCNTLSPGRMMHYSIVIRVAVGCSVLQYAAVCCSVLQCVSVFCSMLQCDAVCCNTFSRGRRVHCSIMIRVLCWNWLEEHGRLWIDYEITPSDLWHDFFQRTSLHMWNEFFFTTLFNVWHDFVFQDSFMSVQCHFGLFWFVAIT